MAPVTCMRDASCSALLNNSASALLANVTATFITTRPIAMKVVIC